MTGKHLNNIKDGMTNKKDVKMCQKTSMEGIGYLEGLENMTSNRENMTTIKEENKEIDKLNLQYNTLLREYEREYVSFVEALFFNDYYKSLGQYVKYREQIIQGSDGKQYYLNEYGILRPADNIDTNTYTEKVKNEAKKVLKTTSSPMFKAVTKNETTFNTFLKEILKGMMFSQGKKLTKENEGELEKTYVEVNKKINYNTITGIVDETTTKANKVLKSSNCPKEIKLTNVSQEILNIFARGPEVKETLGCKTKIGNIKNKKTGKIGFVDMFGELHEYKNFDEAPITCPKQFDEVTDEEWNLYKKGASIEKKNDMCVIPNLNMLSSNKIKEKHNELKMMTANLEVLGKQLLEKAKTINPDNQKTKNKLNMHTNQLENKIKKLSVDQDNLNKEMVKYKAYKKEFQDTNAIYNQSLIKYSLLGGAALLLGFGVYKFMRMNNSSSGSVIDNSVSKSISDLNL